MLQDGIELAEGSEIKNDSVAKGSVFPDNSNTGELFYIDNTSNSNAVGLHVYGTSWKRLLEEGDSSGNASLPANTVAGTYKSVTVDATGIVLSGSNPTTLAGYGITDAQAALGFTPYNATNPNNYTSNLGSVTTFAFTSANGFTGSVSNSSTTPTLSLTLQSASATQAGQLSSTDWNTFNGKQAGNANLTSVAALSSASTGLVKFINGVASLDTNSYLTVAPVTSVAGRIGDITLAKADVGLSNVDNTSDTNKPVSTAQQTALNSKVDNSQLGVANGVATLGSDGKIASGQLPAAIVGATIYQGTWNASTNTPTLVAGTGTKGYYYKVSVAGNTSIDGNSNWTVGDIIIFDGVTWDAIQGGTSDVSSVFGRVGAVTLLSSDVTSALGFTPYNATNPNGFTNNTGTVTSFSFTNANGFTGSVSNSGTTPTLSLTMATASAVISGQLSSTDWTTFNSKQAGNANLTSVAALSTAVTGLVKFTNGVASFDTSSYLTGNQSIAVSGDATGSGTTAITLTLANTGVSAGSYSKVTVDAKGRVTSGTNPTTLSGYGITDAQSALSGTGLVKSTAGVITYDTNTYLTANQSITVSGDATGSGTNAIALTLANSGVSAGTYKSVTVDAKGRVTAATNPTTIAGYGITDAVSTSTPIAMSNQPISGVKTVTFNSQPVLATTTGTIAVDWTAANAYKQTQPTGAITYTFTNPAGPCHLQMYVDSSGASTAQTFTWPAAVIWFGAVWAGVNNKKAIINFWYDGSGNYYATGMNQV